MDTWAAKFCLFLYKTLPNRSMWPWPHLVWGCGHQLMNHHNEETKTKEQKVMPTSESPQLSHIVPLVKTVRTCQKRQEKRVSVSLWTVNVIWIWSFYEWKHSDVPSNRSASRLWFSREASDGVSSHLCQSDAVCQDGHLSACLTSQGRRKTKQNVSHANFFFYKRCYCSKLEPWL